MRPPFFNRELHPFYSGNLINIHNHNKTHFLNVPTTIMDIISLKKGIYEKGWYAFTFHPGVFLYRM